jgi:tRNA(Arg) A34 adenosine deaminase TadA
MEPGHSHFMDRAIALAREAMDEGNGPAGCVIVRDGEALGEGRNLVETSFDPTAHGEMMAIRNVARSLRTTDFSGATLYSTMEPCPMCCWAIINANISTLVLGARHAEFRRRDLGSYSVEALAAMTGRRLEIIEGVRERECEDLRYAALELLLRKARESGPAGGDG